MSEARNTAVSILNGARMLTRGAAGSLSGGAKRGAGIADLVLGLIVRIIKRDGEEKALATLKRLADEGAGPITDDELESDVQDVLRELRGE